MRLKQVRAPEPLRRSDALLVISRCFLAARLALGFPWRQFFSDANSRVL